MAMETPAHAYAKHLDPDREPIVRMHLEFGQAYHAIMLEPETFVDKYVICPHPKDYPKECLLSHEQLKEKARELGLKVGGSKVVLAKRLRDEGGVSTELLWPLIEETFKEQSEGKVILAPDDGEKLSHMAGRMREHPLAVKALEPRGEHETSIWWIDQETGLLLKVRPDKWVHDRHLADLKSAVTVEPKLFAAQAYKFGYHIQMAMYLDGVEQATNEKLYGEFYFLAQEKTAPYAVNVFLADEDLMVEGYNEYRRGVRMLAECLDKNQWPAYGTGLVDMGLPLWRKRQLGIDDFKTTTEE